MEQQKADWNRGESVADAQRAGDSRAPERSRVRGFFDVAGLPAIWQVLAAAEGELRDTTGNGVQSA